jgi:hypothetical protein
MKQLQTIRADLVRSRTLPAYEAVDVAWVAVVKTANLLSGDSEHRRLLVLLDRLPENRIRLILQHKSVDALLNLDPPLESVFSAPPYERLDVSRTAKELSVVRGQRENGPRQALLNLTQMLKRVRNRRAHGFKTPDGPRDQVILEASAHILRSLGETAVDALS